jgi:hypothetical protein
MTRIAQHGETAVVREPSIAAIGGSTRFIAGLAALLAVGIVDSRPAGADMAIVQQDATPVASKPGVGGRILTHVDTGFRLIVLGSDGEWLRVASPLLHLSGNLWVPAGRVGDFVATPADLVLPETAAAEVPQFRMVTTTEDLATTSAGTGGAVGASESTNASAAASRSTSNANGSTTQATGSSTPSATAAATPTDNPVPAEGNPTPAVGNAVQPLGNPTPAVSGNPTGALGNPTPALGNPTPALGNPTPALGNPTPAMGNSTPAMGNTVVTVGN